MTGGPATSGGPAGPSGPVLVCAATARELSVGGIRPDGGDIPPNAPGSRIFAVTGVGIPMTLARLAPLIASLRPALIVNVGIAGAYPGSGLAVGDLVAGESEVFGDIGMELPGPEAFLPLGGMPWADPEYREPLPLTLAPFHRPGHFPRLRAGRGCTVNACAGRRETGELRRRLFGADFESMEGAAAALAGSLAGIPVAEVRAISNIAAERDMRPANVDRALENLGAFLRLWLGDSP